jgi:hypothetical protein
MSFQIITPKSVGYTRPNLPVFAITKPGKISLSRSLVQFLKLKNKDKVTIAWDEKQLSFYIGVTPKGNEGFNVSISNSESATMHGQGLVNKFCLHYNIIIDKKETYKMEVDLDLPTRQFNQEFYRIKK